MSNKWLEELGLIAGDWWLMDDDGVFHEVGPILPYGPVRDRCYVTAVTKGAITLESPTEKKKK